MPPIESDSRHQWWCFNLVPFTCNFPRSHFRNHKFRKVQAPFDYGRPKYCLSVQLYAIWFLFLEHPWYQSRFWAVTFVLRPVTCRRSAATDFWETHREVLGLNSINENSINLGWIAPGPESRTCVRNISWCNWNLVSKICNLMLANAQSAAMPWASFLFEVVGRRIFLMKCTM
jgi:hypothetical protein